MLGAGLKSSQCTIWYLDTGSRTEYAGDKNSKEYGAIIGEKAWQSLTVDSADLAKAMPTAGIQLNSTQILVFGGQKTTTFILDVGESGAFHGARIKTCRPCLRSRGMFGYESDYVARSFGHMIYMVDANQMNLHVYSAKDLGWNAQPLSALGID